MSVENNKENLPEDFFDLKPQKGRRSSVSPKKLPKKTRSKSIGPGGVEATSKQDVKNRRKSTAVVTAVKSILTSKEDEAKRREARRKSLANRRVSFAPEATLHTWDVIEYIKDATTSSASSNSTRRGSSISQDPAASSPQSSPGPSSDVVEVPSTPPERVEEIPPSESPAHQRDLHQKKRRRRSSGIPPMNFNNPDEDFTSSPYSSSPAADDSVPDENSEGDGSTVMSLDLDDVTERTTASIGSTSSTGSSAQLERNLRQAAAQAGTQGIGFDENGDDSVAMDDEIETSAPKSHEQGISGTPKPHRTALQNKENVDSLSPAAKASATAKLGADSEEEDSFEGEDKTMEMTQAVGSIAPPTIMEPIDNDDATMDITMAFGTIQGRSKDEEAAGGRSSLKRRRASVATSQPNDIVVAATGSPTEYKSRRKSVKRRRSSADGSSYGDETMDLTMAIGGIEQAGGQLNEARLDQDGSFADETMDFTMVIGGIKSSEQAERTIHFATDAEDDNEDLSMEFTAIVGGIRSAAAVGSTPVKEAPGSTETASKASSMSPKKGRGRPRKSIGLSPAKATPNPQKSASTIQTKSPRLNRNSVAALATSNGKIYDLEPKATPPTFSSTVETISSPKIVRRANVTTPSLADSVYQDVFTQQNSPKQAIHEDEQKLVDIEDDDRPVEPPVKSAAALVDSIKLLSTPRKMSQQSPSRRMTPIKTGTPKQAFSPLKSPSPQKPPPQKASPRKSSPRKVSPRRSLSPKKRVRIAEGVVDASEAGEKVEHNISDDEEAERIHLYDFLEMTNIRFMDLTTTKRRHTAAPSSISKMATDGENDEAQDENLENWVTAAACTLPEYEMFQHGCSELKKGIATVKDTVRQIEQDVYEETPPLFTEYLSAPLDQRYLMDTQFKNMKTNARLESKDEWYKWRSRLLADLKAPLLKTLKNFASDADKLKAREDVLDQALPGLLLKFEEADAQCRLLQQRQDELASCDADELEAARSRLLAADSEIEAKRARVAALQQQLKDKEAAVEAVKERKDDCAEEIKAAERVLEECRGWTVSEVDSLKGRVAGLEAAYGWSIVAAAADSSSPPTLTMSYRGDLELHFQPSRFGAPASENGPISLTYVGDSPPPQAGPRRAPRPLTTTKRFVLQFLRAHLQCLPQRDTPAPALLRLVSGAWDLALALAAGARGLERDFITAERIVADDALEVEAHLVLAELRSKVRVRFRVGLGAAGGEGIQAGLEVAAASVYGESYDEPKMMAFLAGVCGGEVRGMEEARLWGRAVRDLKARLIARGKKV